MALMLGSTPIMAWGEDFFDESFCHLKDELATAKDEGKVGLLLFFEMEECPFYQKMKTTVFIQPQVRDSFKQHCCILAIDINSDVGPVDFKGQNATSPSRSFPSARIVC
ncbi:MAG: hypothetical protein ABWU16_00430 [Halothiobacillaceae bacterium]